MSDNGDQKIMTGVADAARAHPDGKRHALRVRGAAVTAAIGGLGGEAAGTAHERLVDAWQAMLAELELGSAPDVVACPSCGATVMALATRCGHCWRSLVIVTT